MYCVRLVGNKRSDCLQEYTEWEASKVFFPACHFLRFTD